MDFLFLTNTALFDGISEAQMEGLLDCLGAEKRRFSKGEVIFRAGTPAAAMGIVLSGSVMVENDDVWGNKSILDRIGPGQVFAEAYACLPGEVMMVSVTAAEAAEVLFLNAGRLVKPCPHACGFHSRLTRNLLAVTAQKNLNLSMRIFHTSSKTIRGRLLSYLSFEARRQGGRRVVSPFNRQQLADYLGVDRSALSNELSKMQQDGLLSCEKNVFLLKQAQAGDLFSP